MGLLLVSMMSLQERKDSSDGDPLLSQVRANICDGWPSKVPEELLESGRLKQELTFWNITCEARGLCTVVPGVLHARMLWLWHEGYLGILKLKHCCKVCYGGQG